jgi:hypothetical protein
MGYFFVCEREMAMKKIFAVLAVLFLLAVVACSSSGGGDDTSTPAASKKAITAFSLNGVVGTINEAAKTIAVTLPSGTDVTNLVATFTTIGVSVEVGSTIQVSGTTANDFTIPVTYTVTAVDTTTQDYTVTVTIGDVNQPATAISVSMSPNNPSTATSSIIGSYVVTDTDGGSVIVTEWYDNGVLRQSHTTTLASGVTSGTDTLSGGFSLNHTITFNAIADGVPSNTVSATVTSPGSTTPFKMSGTIHVGSNSGAVLSGATVSIAGFTTTTSSTGTFTITGIPTGTYAFSVSKLGYDTYTNSSYYVGSNQPALNFYVTAKYEQFVGIWTNVDPNTNDITRVTITEPVENKIYVNMWGKCHPTDCYWGTESTSIEDSADGVLSITWTFSSEVKDQQLTILSDGRLRVFTHTHFTNTPGSDYDVTSYFSKP